MQGEKDDMKTDSLQVECAADCGNAPRKQLLKEFLIALASNDFDYCMDWFAEDAVWHIAGGQEWQGIDEIGKFLRKMMGGKVVRLHIDNIITHGNTAAANGTLTLLDQQTIAFCDIFRFAGFSKSAKIKAVTSYVINT